MKRWLVFLGISWIAFDAQANEALGRLFFTPEQRDTFDQARIDFHRPGRVPVSGPLPSPRPKISPVMDKIQVNGIVISSRGQYAAWINEELIYEGSPATNGLRITRHPISGVSIILPNGTELTARMKPGQVFNAESGELSEPYQTNIQSSASPYPPPPL